MILVFLSFVATPELIIKQIGLGLAAAILIDATLIRMVLVPATMELLGARNWGLPGWLDKALPEVKFEAPPPPTETVREPVVTGGAPLADR
jgi:RND superfamily putative drug exporter